MEEIDLNPTDHAILEMLAEGRCSPAYIAEEHDYSRQNVTNRLRRLVEHGYVEKLHPGLYELVDDPRSEGRDKIDTGDLERLGEYEGVEVYKLSEKSLYLTTESIREGDGGLMLSYDTLQNLAVEHREEME